MPDSAQLKSSDGVNFDIEKHGRLYFLNHVKSSMSAEQSVRSLKEWHEVLGHCNIGDVIRVEKVVEGMKITGKRDFECGVCVEGKMAQYRCREPDKRATKPLDLVHADLAGPVDPMAKDGFRYALAFVDDYSGLVMIYFLKHKGDTVNATKRFLADSAPYGIVKRLRTDQGGEFLSDEFENLLVQSKIKHERSAPYSPHQNGTVERSWRSLFEMARCMLIDSKLPKISGLMPSWQWHMSVTDASIPDCRKRVLRHSLATNPVSAICTFLAPCATLMSRWKRSYMLGVQRESLWGMTRGAQLTWCIFLKQANQAHQVCQIFPCCWCWKLC